MKLIIDIPQGLKIDFENENWTALTCAEMKNALINGIPLDDIRTEIYNYLLYCEHIKYDEMCEVLQIIDKYIGGQE